jgi:hypothetical protein
MHMIFLHVQSVNHHIIRLCCPLQHILCMLRHLIHQNALPVFRRPNQVVLQIIDRVAASSYRTHCGFSLQRHLPNRNSTRAFGAPAFLPPASWGASSGSLVRECQRLTTP